MKTKKNILAITVPIVLFFTALKIAGVVGSLGGYYMGELVVKPFNFNKTWWIWILYVVIVAIIELKIFEKK